MDTSNLNHKFYIVIMIHICCADVGIICYNQEGGILGNEEGI